MYKIQHYCDGEGCGAEMTADELASCQTEIHRVVRDLAFNPEHARLVMTEIFCPRCLEHSSDYWKGRSAIFQDAGKVLERRLQNHKRQFWGSRLAKPKHEKLEATA